jgi:gamma-glutamylcyclotransferase (GGCT)/AIG2-like uncharacterized protein YtfP
MDRIFIYGTLAPGKPNEHVMADIPGEWEPATVRGRLHEEGWGAALGYPGIILGPEEGEVQGLLFSSPELGEHLERLDEFEGEGYERVLTKATTHDGRVFDAYIYCLKRDL